MKTGVKYSVIWLFSLFCIYILYTEAAYPCDYNLKKQAKGYFKPVTIPATWADARLHCHLEGATLASPFNADMRNEMMNIMKNFYKSFNQIEVFTGFHATFSKGNFYSVEGSPLIEVDISWTVNEPDNMNNSEQCITLNKNGELADRSCYVPRHFICFRPEDIQYQINECGTEDPEYTLDTRTGSCYKVHTVPRSFERAHFACSAEGAYLAIINSQVESTVLKELFAKYPANKFVSASNKDNVFVGVYDWGEPGDWRTLNGSTLKEAGFDVFASGQPNNATPGEFCGAIDRSGLLNDIFCDQFTGFICEKPRLKCTNKI